MFVGQAARQFELFTGRTAPVEVMREALRRAISAARTS
jgi:shikimate 5-dehydrogenase